MKTQQRQEQFCGVDGDVITFETAEGFTPIKGPFKEDYFNNADGETRKEIKKQQLESKILGMTIGAIVAVLSFVIYKKFVRK